MPIAFAVRAWPPLEGVMVLGFVGFAIRRVVAEKCKVQHAIGTHKAG